MKKSLLLMALMLAGSYASAQGLAPAMFKLTDESERPTQSFSVGEAGSGTTIINVSDQDTADCASVGLYTLEDCRRKVAEICPPKPEAKIACSCGIMPPGVGRNRLNKECYEFSTHSNDRPIELYMPSVPGDSLPVLVKPLPIEKTPRQNI